MPSKSFASPNIRNKDQLLPRIACVCYTTIYNNVIGLIRTLKTTYIGCEGLLRGFRLTGYFKSHHGECLRKEGEQRGKPTFKVLKEKFETVTGMIEREFRSK